MKNSFGNLLNTCVFNYDSISLTLSVNMAGNDVAIKLFGFVRRTFENIGISRPPFRQNNNPINFKKWLIPVGEGQFFISTAAHLLFETNSSVEYGMVFFTCASISLSITIYLILSWQMTDILDYIGNCERFIEKSE